MKKRLSILCLMLAILLTGCSSGVLEYHVNLGYDVNDIDCQTIVFHMYQANQENHHWQQLTTIEYQPQKNNYFDVDCAVQNHVIVFCARENNMIKEKDSVRYDSRDIGSYEHELSSANQLSYGMKTFEIKDVSEEQLFRLYAFNDEAITFYEAISLDKPYDEENNNIDNILITVTFKD